MFGEFCRDGVTESLIVFEILRPDDCAGNVVILGSHEAVSFGCVADDDSDFGIELIGFDVLEDVFKGPAAARKNDAEVKHVEEVISNQ